MAVHEVVLDPDGDILVIVPGKPPQDLAKPSSPSSGETNLNGTEPAEDVPVEAPAEYVPIEAPAEEAVNNEEHQPDASVPQEEEEWRFKASSKHLSLASTNIKKMMTGWREGNETHDDGLVHWGLSGFDVDAISIILSVIHGLNRRVPRTVSLARLAQIALVVDYLDCHEVMELYASIWVDRIGDSIKDPSREDWDGWITVAGVFQNAPILKRWTRVAIIQKLNGAPSLELPILSKAYDLIEQRRQEHLDKIVSSVYTHLDRLSEQKVCSVECDAILLGTLIRQLRANSLPSVRPTRPYEGLSFGNVVNTIKGLTVPEWYSKVNETEEFRHNPFDFWGATKKVSKSHSKKAKTKVKKSVSVGGFGQAAVEDFEELEDLVVVEHHCGFDGLLATVNSLESEIQGLDLESDLGIMHAG
ncbi:hypothetical protein F5Y09DRAFT_266127 [Xylaria sp. FL1042]|nr:hypothetical protein F5Y09DRAFT_266127 [Xylaria sp. FL1042]